jgi:uncharacterized membrane protein YcaP (DUF421 family)
MDKEDIKLSDWQRILFGNAPVEFMAEVAVRTIIIFILLLVCVKLMGKRMAGKLTIIELSVMLTLGAIVSVPMQIPERGLLLGVLTLTCAYFFQRGFNWLAVKYHKMERISHGSMDIVIEDGIVQLDKLAKNRVSVNQLFSNLRQEKVHNLGALERVYMEAGGSFSIYKFDEPKPGLPLLPAFEKISNFEEIKPGWQSCATCGYTREKQEGECQNCHYNKWMDTVN